MAELTGTSMPGAFFEACEGYLMIMPHTYYLISALFLHEQSIFIDSAI